jgi:glycosyltransferase involved in cell wall biosynthesis
MQTVSIIIPVFNEQDTIKSILCRVKNVQIGMKKQVIAVDDGSTDNTKEIISRVKEITFVSHHKNLGKGAAIRTGLSHAAGDYILIQDADLEYDPKDYTKLLQPITDRKADAVLGTRYTKTKTRSNAWKRGVRLFMFGNLFLNFIMTLLYFRKITDFGAGHKAFRADVIKNLHLQANGFDFDAEATVKLFKQGYRVVEVPITYVPRTFSEGKKTSWKDGLRALYWIVKCRF